jgi:thiosulfate/3-mercaptopyruvate sulfurtransferase
MLSLIIEPADKRVITHCQTHYRAGLTCLIDKHPGEHSHACDGAGAEWRSNPESPVECP